MSTRRPAEPDRPTLATPPAPSGPSVARGGSSHGALGLLTLAALGVVYGDIGTSPLYALKECFGEVHHIPPTPENVLGILSLIFWSLNFVISVKYITVLLRADNQGEGGILALLALVRPPGEATGTRRALVLLGLFGAALLYGDGVITPAISVLGAVEGLTVTAPGTLSHLVVPITVLILIGLFLFQRWGTTGVGIVFGPVMIVWFSCIAILGVGGILREPSVLRAVNPWHAVDFFMRDGLRGFLTLGAVVLVLTGGEALYADMGHFGRRPIRLAWFSIVLPALLLNYFGQGALLLHDPSAASNPFYRLAPEWFRYPLIGIATVAAVTASQALISGAFSLTRQAVQLGYSPRVTIWHTSRAERGQIFVPGVNKALAVACIALVVGFKTSTNLAAAYGVAVTGTMAITTILFSHVALNRWRWPMWRVVSVSGLFLMVDLAFLGANLVKVEQGGWFPLLVGVGVFTLMATWKRGRVILSGIMRDNSLPLDLFIGDVVRRKPYRVPGVAVFMTSDPGGAPPVLLHHLKHNKVLHEKVILMSVQTADVPQVPEAERVEYEALAEGFYAVMAHYGFMETPDVPAILRALESKGLGVKMLETSFYLGRETLLPSGQSKLPRWRKKLFILMSRNAQSATAFFNLPANRVVELGAQIQF